MKIQASKSWMLESNTYCGTLPVNSICFLVIMGRDSSAHEAAGNQELHVGERLLR